MQTFASIVVPPVSTRCGLQYGLQRSKAGNVRVACRYALATKPRYPGAPGIFGSPQHSAHGAIHRNVADAVQGFLATVSAFQTKEARVALATLASLSPQDEACYGSIEGVPVERISRRSRSIGQPWRSRTAATGPYVPSWRQPLAQRRPSIKQRVIPSLVSSKGFAAHGGPPL